MSMIMDYENLLVIVVVTNLNLKKFGVGWFERILERVLWNLWNGRNEMMSLLYNNVIVVNLRW